MEDAVCGQCMVPGKLPDGRMVNMNRPMDLIGQFPVHGVPTFSWHCMGCNGKAHTQQHADPRTGQPQWVQVRLQNTDQEFRPNSIRPGEQVQIQAAYSLGNSAAAHASHVQVAPLPPPAPAYSLDPRVDPNMQLPPNHPMHPSQIRARMQPVRPEDWL